MKKTNTVKYGTLHPNKIANAMRRELGGDKAFRVANTLAKNMSEIGLADVNSEIFTHQELTKNKRVWEQVKNILKKVK